MDGVSITLAIALVACLIGWLWSHLHMDAKLRDLQNENLYCETNVAADAGKLIEDRDRKIATLEKLRIDDAVKLTEHCKQIASLSEQVEAERERTAQVQEMLRRNTALLIETDAKRLAVERTHDLYKQHVRELLGQLEERI